MAVRRSLNKENSETPRRVRRSLRLENKKGAVISQKTSLAYQRSAASIVRDTGTPRTIFKKVLQNQPVISPLLPEKPDPPKSVKIVPFHSKNITDKNLEISFSNPAPKQTSQIALVKTRSKKKFCLSEFERAVDEQLASNSGQSSLDNTSLTKSLQIHLTTPVPLLSPGKKGLTRRPKNCRGVDVKTFEGGIEPSLFHVKDSQTYLVDLQTSSLLSNDTGALSARKPQFATSQQSDLRLSVPSPHAKTRQSLAREKTLPSAQKPRLGAELDMDVRATESNPKGASTQDIECTDVASGAKMDGLTEEEQDSLWGGEGGLKQSRLTATLTPNLQHADGMEAISGERAADSERGQEMELQENSNTEPLLSTGKHLATDMTPVRSSTPTHSEHPEVPPGHLPAVLYEKFTRHSLKESVSSTIQELNRSIPAVLSSSETNVEEDPFTNENIVQVTQRSAESPSRRSGRKNSVQLEGPRTEEMVEGATRQTGDECRTREMMDVQAENDVISEAEMHFEDEETSEAETDHRNIDPAGSTPAFVHARAFPGTPLLPGARAPKVAASISLSKQSSQKQISKPPEKVHRRKHEPALPRSFIKKIFGHYVRMPVAKDAFNAVERCVSLYFKHLSDDLEAYANHARRKTVEPADLELLMRRQDLVTEKMPLNVLIEHHLPLEYRKLLIPVATSGNKVTPSKPL